MDLEFSPFYPGASSCNWKCTLGYGDIVRILDMLLIIHDSLAELQKAKLCMILHFSLFVGHKVKSPQFSDQV